MFSLKGFTAHKRVFNALKSAAVKVFEPHKASLAKLADMPLTVLGAASIDFAAFHISHGWGWLAVGASLFFLEYLIADDE